MIQTAGLSYTIGDFRLRDVSLEVGAGEYFVLLGSPGSGKTLFLECLCGLRRIQEGRVLIGGRDVTGLEPRERSVGYMPQDYALFPHTDVWGNIVFGLRRRRLPQGEILQKARHAADLLGISHLLGRGVRGLSGGEKQRVALARALVLSPKALLLDEPVSALDESTRESVCLQLKHIQRRTGTTTVHVCHNFEEARTVADRVGILRDGRLVQVGAVEDVFSHPAGPETARFLRVGNILSGTAEPSGGLAVIKVGDTPILCGTKTEGQAEFAIPSEAISVSLAPPGQDVAGSGVNVLSGAVTAVLPRGPFDQVVVRVSPELTLTAYAPRTSQRIESGKPVHLRFPAEAVHVFGR